MRSRVGSDSARNDFKVEDMIFRAPKYFQKTHLTRFKNDISSYLDTSICY